MRKKPAIYVGCALTHAPEKFKKDITRLKDMLRKDFIVLDFLGQSTEFTSQQVFEYDIDCVRKCDVLVANMTYPGLGIGAEFGVAVERKKPIITIAEKSAVVSRFVFGYANPHHFVYRYDNFEDAAAFVLQKLQELFPLSTFAAK